MKRLVTFMICAASLFSAAGQVPNYLPYNPDSNSDNFISLPDLLEFLIYYGNDWQNGELIVAQDSTDALLHVGVLYQHECIYACSSLQGNWRVADRKDYLTHAPEVASFYGTELILDNDQASQTDGVWWRESDHELRPTTVQGWYDQNGSQYGLNTNPFLGSSVYIDGVYQPSAPLQKLGCWCSTQVAPRMEYLRLTADEYAEQVESLSNQGWYLIFVDGSSGRVYFGRYAQ